MTVVQVSYTLRSEAAETATLSSTSCSYCMRQDVYSDLQGSGVHEQRRRQMQRALSAD